MTSAFITENQTTFTPLYTATTTYSINTTTRAPTRADVSLASSIILTVLSSILFAAATIVLFLYYWKRIGRGFVETRIGVVIFFLGALLTTITTLGCYKHDKIYGVYRLLVEVSVGIVLMIAGVVLLFERQNPDRGLDEYGRRLIPVGHTHGSMGIVIWVITLPLSALEMFFAIGAATKSPAPVYAAVEFVSFTQKLIQASIYHFSLRHKVPRPLMRMGCSWFLKTISLFNFALWIDSIVTSRTDNAFVMELFGNGFSIVKSSYNALLIDYRLLCSLLFLEHAFELEDTGESRRDPPYEQVEDPRPDDREALLSSSVNVEVVQYSGYGYIIGLICVGLSFVNGLQYLGFVGDWTNIFPILSNFSVILFGLLLLGGCTPTANNDSKWRETESKAIDVMVGFMGAIGFIFRLMKSSFCLVWTFSAKPFDLEAQNSYLVWTSMKNLLRAIGVLFQLYFFVNMGPHYCLQSRNIRRRMCHILVPAIMLALLSIFTSCVIDQYNGPVEHLINQSQLDRTITSFFEAAAPIHLGFSLHMFLHFYIIKRKMKSLEYVYPRRDVHISQVTDSLDSNESENGRNEREPLLYSNTRAPATV